MVRSRDAEVKRRGRNRRSISPFLFPISHLFLFQIAMRKYRTRYKRFDAGGCDRHFAFLCTHTSSPGL